MKKIKKKKKDLAEGETVEVPGGSGSVVRVEEETGLVVVADVRNSEGVLLSNRPGRFDLGDDVTVVE